MNLSCVDDVTFDVLIFWTAHLGECKNLDDVRCRLDKNKLCLPSLVIIGLIKMRLFILLCAGSIEKVHIRASQCGGISIEQPFTISGVVECLTKICRRYHLNLKRQ